jgi:hypothetical protein
MEAGGWLASQGLGAVGLLCVQTRRDITRFVHTSTHEPGKYKTEAAGCINLFGPCDSSWDGFRWLELFLNSSIVSQDFLAACCGGR